MSGRYLLFRRNFYNFLSAVLWQYFCYTSILNTLPKSSVLQVPLHSHLSQPTATSLLQFLMCHLREAEEIDGSSHRKATLIVVINCWEP